MPRCLQMLPPVPHAGSPPYVPLRNPCEPDIIRHIEPDNQVRLRIRGHRVADHDRANGQPQPVTGIPSGELLEINIRRRCLRSDRQVKDGSQESPVVSQRTSDKRLERLVIAARNKEIIRRHTRGSMLAELRHRRLRQLRLPGTGDANDRDNERLWLYTALDRHANKGLLDGSSRPETERSSS